MKKRWAFIPAKDEKKMLPALLLVENFCVWEKNCFRCEQTRKQHELNKEFFALCFFSIINIISSSRFYSIRVPNKTLEKKKKTNVMFKFSVLCCCLIVYCSSYSYCAIRSLSGWSSSIPMPEILITTIFSSAKKIRGKT